MIKPVRLKAGETVIVSAMSGDEHPDQGLPQPEQPVDPGYGIDLGLGYVRPSHPIVIPPPVEPPVEPTEPVDPGYGIDVDIGYVKPEHPIVLPPPPSGGPAPNWELKTAWTPTTGWVVVAIPTGEHVTPSKKR
jgi:hypothetical protein